MNKKTPILSVIIASVNGFPIIGECLQSLYRQSGVDDLEVIVANRCDREVAETLRQTYPWVKLIQAPPQTTIPDLRALALRESTGDLVGVLEDHCIVEKDWAKKMIHAHERDYPVIGGAVENGACKRLVDWAAFFCEYSQAMLPLPEGEADQVPGNNVVYKRWILERFEPLFEKGMWDFLLHEKIREAKITLYLIPSITVTHKLSRSLLFFMAQKFHFARSFAGERFSGAFKVRRILYGAGAILLPLLLSFRIAVRVWKKGRHRRELVLSSPMLFLLFISWGAGEFLGYLTGPGGSSAKVS